MLVASLDKAFAPLRQQFAPEQIFLLTTEHVLSHAAALAVPEANTLVLPSGEENKSLHTVERIWQFLLDRHATRRALLVSMGGGMLTDLGGFAAATYKRGIAFVHIPTTLLAMVDASTGGKTGFNFAGLKNCIGTFSQPVATLICPSLLRTLPMEQWLSGYGEMLKHGLLASTEMWHRLLRYDIEQGDEAVLGDLIEESLRVKERIVAADPEEHGLRKALNFGHTVGHALESLAIEQGVESPHGYCVVWGMVAALYLSVTRLGCEREPLTQLTHLMVQYYGRPRCNCRDAEQLLVAMRQDKKNIDTSTIRFTLLRHVGEPVVDVPLEDDAIREAVDYLMSI